MVEAERARVATLQAACEAAGVDSPLPAPPASPPAAGSSSASLGPPLVGGASPLPPSQAAAAAAIVTPQRGGHPRASLDEFRQLEAECEIAGMHSPMPAQQCAHSPGAAGRPAPSAPAPAPAREVAPVYPSQQPQDTPSWPPSSLRPHPSYPNVSAHDADADAAADAAEDDDDSRLGAAFAPRASSTASSSRASSAASSLRASEDSKLASVLACLEAAESRTAQQQRVAAAATCMSQPPKAAATTSTLPPSGQCDSASDAFPHTSRRLGFGDSPDSLEIRPAAEVGRGGPHRPLPAPPPGPLEPSAHKEAAGDDEAFVLARGSHRRRERPTLHEPHPPTEAHPSAAGASAPRRHAAAPSYASSSDMGPRAPSAPRDAQHPSHHLQSASAAYPAASAAYAAASAASAASFTDGAHESYGHGCHAAPPPAYVTPPGAAAAAAGGANKQQQRASELANTVYAGVKHKMSLMKEELLSLREGSAELQRKLAQKEVEAQAAAERAHAEAEERLANEKAATEETVKRHVEFIDRLLADKAELAKQCEGLAGQMRSLEERYAAGEAKREEAYAKELRKQKELWGQAEKAKREQWLADKTKEIKESTVRGLEPDIQRLVQRHRDEAARLELALREEHKRELEAERNRHTRELSRMQEAGVAERQAAQEREREVCAQRLGEMSNHFEEQLRQQRARSASASAAEQEERDAGRRREIARLEEELRELKLREASSLEGARQERLELQERLTSEARERLESERAAHALARSEWEAAFEGEVGRRLEKERASLEAAAAQARQAQVAVVVDRLGSEMAQAEMQWKGKLDAAHRQAEARVADAQRGADEALEDVRRRYVASVERTAQLEARLAGADEELAKERGLAGDREADAERLRLDADARVAEAREGGERAASQALAALHASQGERAAMSDELAQLRAEQRAMLSAHEAQLQAVKGAKEHELAQVGERVRELERRKDEAIGTLQSQVASLQGELHTTREQLHATQQEILSFS